MASSKMFEDYVASHIINGIERREGKYKVSLRVLSDYLLNQLSETGVERFGYRTKTDARTDIHKIFISVAEGRGGITNLANLDLRKVIPGSIISFTHDGGWRLRTQITDSGALLVIQDDENTLLPGDILYPLQLALNYGKDVYFHVERDGHSHPSKNLYLYLADISSIDIQENDGKNLLMAQRNENASSLMGCTTVYAHRPSEDGSWFYPENLTVDSKGSVFKIKFNPDGSISYTLNDDLDFGFESMGIEEARSLHREILDSISVGFDTEGERLIGVRDLYVKEDGELRAKTLPNGSIVLQITQKAIIGKC